MSQSGTATRTIGFSAGSRGEMLALIALALGRALPATVVGDQLRRLLGQPLLLPLEARERRDTILGNLRALRCEQQTREPGFDLVAEHHLSLR